MADIEPQVEELLAVVAEEYLERLRRGEQPAISEYTRRHPRLAERIEVLLPTLGLVKAFKPGSGDATGPFGAARVPGPEIDRERLGDFRILREVGRGGMGSATGWAVGFARGTRRPLLWTKSRPGLHYGPVVDHRPVRLHPRPGSGSG